MWDLISGAQLDEYLDQGKRLFLVDMRDARAYRRAHIRGAVNIPYGELRARIGELPQESLIVLYCYHGPNRMGAASSWAGNKITLLIPRKDEENTL